MIERIARHVENLLLKKVHEEAQLGGRRNVAAGFMPAFNFKWKIVIERGHKARAYIRNYALT
jgi:hypothetical protein